MKQATASAAAAAAAAVVEAAVEAARAEVGSTRKYFQHEIAPSPSLSCPPRVIRSPRVLRWSLPRLSSDGKSRLEPLGIRGCLASCLQAQLPVILHQVHRGWFSKVGLQSGNHYKASTLLLWFFRETEFFRRLCLKVTNQV